MAKKTTLSPDFPGTTMDIRCSFQSLIALIVAALVVGAVYLTTECGYLVQEDDQKLGMKGSEEKCDLFSGKWVFDNKSYPLYREEECTFMSDQLACGKFGRNNLDYQHWRWQPHHCDLPRFNATALLERLRNKRLVFVGDSLNRGQWVSMVCLLDKAIAPGRKHMHNNGSALITFKAKDYNARIEFYWAPLLVESNSDDPVSHRLPDRIVRAQAIEKHARHWTDADILVFNTYLWWRRPQMKVLAEEWGKSIGGNCYNETEMIVEEGYRGRGTDPKMMQIVEATIDQLQRRGLNVQMINITQLSDYRKEGHPSIYRKQWEPLTQQQISDPSAMQIAYIGVFPEFLMSGTSCCMLTFLMMHQTDFICKILRRTKYQSDEQKAGLDYFNSRNNPPGNLNEDHEKMVLTTWEILLKFHHLTGLFLVAFLAAVLYLTHDINYWNVVKKQVTVGEEQTAHSDSSPAGYNTTIGFYWSPFLVESNCDDIRHHVVGSRVVRVQAIEKHARHWDDADILVFDTYVWWLETKLTILWGSFGSPDGIYKTVEMKMRRYEMGLSTWSEWLEMNINRTKTKLFFMSVSPYIFRGDISRHCYNRSEPVFQEGYWSVANKSQMSIAESTIKKLERRGVKVEYLRITQMSEQRRDAHPSIYRKFYAPITEENRKDPISYSDCLHWCLPGVPDVWNQILYAYIMNS
ncbi:UNVERIFIED_CONTAM: protein trichome birefringence-like 34 [Sesamum calycinum]|uniref:Protein trichome birefringence-like 34 n=1 Tax=Sesamum calycinum TaxID=2727403 RepID=A0AAW2NX47_9LAMI